MSYEIITLNRDIEALLIPHGSRVLLPQGSEVTITQALGNSYTVNFYGNLARVDGKDADALGKAATTQVDLADDATLEEKIWAQLKTCYDPEISVNIVDLGLVYHCDIKTLVDNQHRVDVTMTLTAPGCGMGPVLTEDAKQKLLALASVTEVNIELVFDPPWDRDKMSETAKLELGLF